MQGCHLPDQSDEELINRSKGNSLRSIALTLPIAFFLWLILLSRRLGTMDIYFFSGLASFIFFVTLFFLMQYTGKTYLYRKIFFITMAVCTLIGLVSNMVDAGGFMTSSVEDRLLLNHNFCQLAIPMVIIPALIDKIVIFPGSLIEGAKSFAAILALWVGVSLAIGRGFCSWFCMFGGFDEGFASIKKKPKLILKQTWTLLPYAVLLAIVLLSAESLVPFFCQWLCPWKTVYRVQNIESLYVFCTVSVSLILFVVLVIVLPIFTGKRAQCSIFCPFAALQSVTNKLNIFDVRIDKEKCNDCGSCIRQCPTLSMDKESMKKGTALMSCTKCGKCIDICKQQAISYHIKGTPVGKRTLLARNFFLYAAFISGSVIASGMLAKTIVNAAGIFIN